MAEARMSPPESPPDLLWPVLDALCRQVAAAGVTPSAPVHFRLEPDAGLVPLQPERHDRAVLIRDARGHWRCGPGWQSGQGVSTSLLQLYLPLFSAAADGSWVVAHLGQSLDGCIATHSGDSCFVTGPQNIMHLHRMRALADAIIVGAGTVASDDPRLTTRLVPGPSPVRVVIDPTRRLAEHHRVFQDGEAPTLLCCAPEHLGAGGRHGRAGIIPIRATAGGLDLIELTAQLRARGLGRLFVEGGGVTVSRFVEAGLVDRLQITVAPMLIGQGRPGVVLRRADSLSRALRAPAQTVAMGEDTCYDLDLGMATGARGGV